MLKFQSNFALSPLKLGWFCLVLCALAKYSSYKGPQWPGSRSSVRFFDILFHLMEYVLQNFFSAWETHGRKKTIHSLIRSYFIAGVPCLLSNADANFKLFILPVSLIPPVLCLPTSRLYFNFPEYQIIDKITIYLNYKENFTCSEKDSGLDHQIRREVLLFYM